MQELEEVAKLTDPDQVFLVVDAMTGQDAVNSAKAFSDRLRLDGVILTKLDGDARGGAAISIRAVTGKPIKFCGVGEKTEDFEEFHTDRMVSRILGLGDVLTLWEKAKDKIDEEEAKKFQNQLVQGELTLDGFLKQLEQVQKMGPIKELMAMIPGVSSMMKDVEVDEKEFTHMKAMIQSMTLEERRNPDVIDHSRRVRISKGSGTDHMDVGRLVKQFKMMRKMVSKQTGLFGRLMGKGNMPVPSMENMDSMPGVSTTTLKDKRMSLLKREKARQERKIRKKEQKKHSR
jgi:signal recognition particle subunit SRP54